MSDTMNFARRSRPYLAAVGVYSLLLSVGCARLEPMAEPGIADLRITVDTLKTAVRDAQRTADELRAELEDQRREFADVQMARAQLQGMLRETERRLADARQIIDLQREELASARVERERAAQNNRYMPTRLHPMPRAVPYQGSMPAAAQESLLSATSTGPVAAEVVPIPTETDGPIPAPGPMAELEPAGDAIPEDRPEQEPPAQASARTIIVNPGDTLWRLSRRHKVDMELLRTLNGLKDYRIIAGHALRLPEPHGGAGAVQH